MNPNLSHGSDLYVSGYMESLLNFTIETPLDKTAIATMDLLEYRLQRIEYVLSGDDEARIVLQRAAGQGKGFTTQARIARLENTILKLSSKSTVVEDLLRLCEDICDELPLNFN